MEIQNTLLITTIFYQGVQSMNTPSFMLTNIYPDVIQNVVLHNFPNYNVLCILTHYQASYSLQILLDLTLQTINQKLLLNLFILNVDPEEETTGITIQQSNFLLFVNTCEDDDLSILEDDLTHLMQEHSWNVEYKFLVIVLDDSSSSPKHCAQIIIELLWGFIYADNAVILIRNTDLEEIQAYTVFPYENGNCGKLGEVVLLRQWKFGDPSSSTYDGMYPSKLPQYFKGCTLTVGSLGPEPYIVRKRLSNTSELQLTGLCIELLSIVAQQLQFNLSFREPIIQIEPNAVISEIVNLQTGELNVLAGAVAVINIVLDMMDISDTYIYDTVKWLVPCPGPTPKVERVLTVFSKITWVGIIIVFICASLIFWCQAMFVCFEPFSRLTQSFSATWAVLLAVSVPTMPQSFQLRSLFLLYVWYCFAIITVFQAYFTTYLVEPGYYEGLKTFDDVVQSEIQYASFEIAELTMLSSGYNVTAQLRKGVIKSTDTTATIKRVMFQKDMFSIVAIYFANYIASVSGVIDKSKAVCLLDESIITTSIGYGFKKGNPLRSKMNIYLSRSLQGGLLEKYWSMLNHEMHLKANNTYTEDSDYVVFSIEHLSPFFFLLLFGYILSSMTFLLEVVVHFINNFRI
ncbi:Ionotropic receptor 651 [Blattella germanica]|nr:Ionotropic receptor 651 [Blattella germanica]